MQLLLSVLDIAYLIESGIKVKDIADNYARGLVEEYKNKKPNYTKKEQKIMNEKNKKR